MARADKSRFLENEPSSLEITVFYSLLFAIALMAYALFWFFFREYMIISFDTIWQPVGSLADAIGDVWPIFLWGFGATLILCVCLKSRKSIFHGMWHGWFKAVWVSCNAGLFEEMIYRWLYFSIALVLMPFFNVITFGFWHWVNVEVLLPVANWATFGILHSQLIDGNWIVGAAILSANSDFRDEHKHLGLLGYINSWYLGMIMFYLMFSFGLWSAIVVHILYDIAVFTAESMVSGYYSAKRHRQRSYLFGY